MNVFMSAHDKTEFLNLRNALVAHFAQMLVRNSVYRLMTFESYRSRSDSNETL